jgi:cyanate permease
MSAITTEDLSLVTFRPDQMRWGVLASFVVVSISNALMWISFSPIVDEVEPYFGITAQEVDLLSMVYLITFSSIVFLSCKLYENLGLKRGMEIGAGLNCVGICVKIMAVVFWRNKVPLFIGQWFNALTQILVIATPPAIAAEWFPQSERTVANALMTSSLNVGIALGMLLPTLLVSPEKQGMKNFLSLFGLEGAVAAIGFFMTVFCFPHHPKSPPSHSAACRDNVESPDLTPQESTGRDAHALNLFSTIQDSVNVVTGNFSFALLAAVTGGMYGIVWSIATILPQLLKPFGITESEAGVMGFLNLSVGTIAAPFVGIYVDRKRNYKPVLVWCTALCTLVLGAMTLVLRFSNGNCRVAAATAYVAWTLSGVCQNVALPVFFELGVELTFPIRETLTSNILLWTPSVVSIMLTLLYGEWLGQSPTASAGLSILATSTLICGVASLLVLAIRPSTRRLHYETAEAAKVP